MKRPWRRCASCDGVCHWTDTAWFCENCGDEWSSDWDFKYRAPGEPRGVRGPRPLKQEKQEISVNMEDVFGTPDRYKPTPTEELILEVLAARYRLGEHIWPFVHNTVTTRALVKLMGAGLVGTKTGNVEHTIQAWLTGTGRDYSLGEDYTSPVAHLRRELEEANAIIAQREKEIISAENKWSAECERNDQLEIQLEDLAMEQRETKLQLQREVNKHAIVV